MGLHDWLLRRARREESTSPRPEIPASATFRRAVGLDFQLSICEGLHRVRVTASRQDRNTRMQLALDDTALLFRMNTWSRADELDVPHARLVELVRQNLLFWSLDRPTQSLS